MDGSLVIMECSSLLRFRYSNGWYPCHYGRQSIVEIIVTPMDGSIVIMEGSLLSISFLFQWMVTISLWKVVCCRDFCYSNGWQPCHYGTQSIIEIFVTPMDGSLVIMEHSLLQIFCYSFAWQPCHYGRQFVVVILLLQWMVALSLWNVVRC